MTNVTRPIFDNVTGARIRYADSPEFNGATGARMVYGSDRSDPSLFDQVTGLPTNVQATVNVTQTNTPDSYDEEELEDLSVSVTRQQDNMYNEYEVLTTAGGQTVSQLRSLFRAQLGLSNDMIAIVDGTLAQDNTRVEAGSNVVFKERAKARGL